MRKTWTVPVIWWEIWWDLRSANCSDINSRQRFLGPGNIKCPFSSLVENNAFRDCFFSSLFPQRPSPAQQWSQSGSIRCAYGWSSRHYGHQQLVRVGRRLYEGGLVGQSSIELPFRRSQFAADFFEVIVLLRAISVWQGFWFIVYSDFFSGFQRWHMNRRAGRQDLISKHNLVVNHRRR